MLNYVNGELNWGGTSLTSIAEEWQTPAYIYNRSVLEEDFLRIKKAFAPYTDTICYALKANSNLEILKILAGLGAGGDIVSMGELFTALKAGIPHEKIVFAGAGKTDEELNFAIKSRLLAINVECIEELRIIERFSENMLQKQPVFLRTNPNIDPGSHPYISTGTSAHKFGINIEEIEETALYCHKAHGLHFMGIHVHIGSMLQKPEPVFRTFEVVAELNAKLESRGIPVPAVDIGGGLPVDYYTDYYRLNGLDNGTPVMDIDSVLSNWTEAVSKNFDTSKMHLVVEPGRAVTANSGILLMKVLYRKKRADKEFIVVDTGMNDMLRPSLYQAFHGVVPLKEHDGTCIKADIVGPICETGDFLARDIMIPECERGDYLALLSAGAYGYVLSSNYNMRPHPAEIMVDTDGPRCIRPRQTYNDLGIL